MDAPLPPASIWAQFPLVAIIILVSLVLVGLFVFYNERRDKSWQTFYAEQRTAHESELTKQRRAFGEMLENQQRAWGERRSDDRTIMQELISEIRSFREDHQEHDTRMLQAISQMEERTRPIAKRRNAT
jgi:hypothetical protein